MRAHVLGLLVISALCASVSGRAAPLQGNGTIVFASSRAAQVIRPAIFTLGIDGHSRRRISPALRGIGAPAWSPGGTAIAYLRHGHPYVIDVRTRRLRRLLRRGTLRDLVWSPDSSQLAAFRERADDSSDLVVIQAEGSGARRVARRVRNVEPFGSGAPAWSPDGTRIAFAREVGRRQEIRAVDLRTGAERRIVETRVVDADPAWSPDGSRIAFTRYYSWDERKWSLAVADLRRGSVTALAKGLEVPAWSPDGRHIAAERGGTVYVLDALGRHSRRVGYDTVDESPSKPPLWSPDSATIIAAYRGEIYKFRADGQGRKRISAEQPSHRLEWTDGLAYVLSVSPDGRRVAYTSRPYDPGDTDIYTIKPDGSALRTLTRNRIDDFDPAWSPDGTSIAFTIGSRYPKIAIRNGRSWRLITRGSQPSWSPDGGRLAFIRSGDVYTVAPDGSREQLVGKGSGAESKPDWSPRGDQLIFASRLADGWDIWAVAPDGSGLRRLTDVRAGRDRCYPANADEPAWSPSGEEIAFVLTEYASTACALHGGKSSVYVMNADGTHPRFVTQGGWADPTGDIGAVSPTWSPDGRQIVFVNELERATRLGIVASSGGRFRLLPHSTGGQSPDWAARR